MANGEKQHAADHNLSWALVIIAIACGLTAFATYLICDGVLASFADSNTMAMLITDAGVKSDDKKLEANLTAATTGLQLCRDLGFALGLGCLGVGVAISHRIFKQNASQALPRG